MDKPQAQVRNNSETSSLKERLNKKVIAASLALGIGITALSGCATSAEGTAPTHSAEAPSPEDTTEPAVETQPTEQDIIRDHIKELNDTPIEEFKFLDRADRLTYLGGTILKKNYPEIFQQHADGEYINAYNPLDVAAIDNSAASIAHQYEYVQRSFFAQRAGDGTTDTFDFEAAQKAMSGFYYMGGDSLVVSGDYSATFQTLEPLTTTTVLTNSYTGEEYGSVTAGVDKDGVAVQYKDILMTNQNGTQYVTRFIFSTFKDANAEEKGIWQPLANTDVSTPELLDTYM